MLTTKIQIKAHLAEWINTKFAVLDENSDKAKNYILIPSELDVYILLWDLITKRPLDAPLVDIGNVEIALPNRRAGKHPQYYNYLSKRAVDIIEDKIELMFFAELRDLFEENKHRLGIPFLETAHHFSNKYQIKSLTEDAMIKDYYRYRVKTQKRRKTVRKYHSSK